ncbi:tetratricopeptide repeat protein [Streptosporangium sandarakinum]|uniref:tetratricopeptide repeat protein n=1 Tax=Streptosporangium sandarakinum TaxID=1260955 RepID=UPI003699AC7B
MAAIDPERIRTSRQLAEQLALLFDRDHRGVQRLAADAGLGAATVQALINGGTALPRAGTVERFVRACGEQPGPWLAARARLAAAARTDHRPAPASAPAEPLGRVIGELGEQDALVLEVHQAFTAAQATADPVPVLPPYLPRNGFDDRLRAAVAAATGGSRLVMVVGGSSTGKTRACWEAIRAVLPGWRVWHPLTPERPPAVVEALRGNRLAARSVIWLNEAQFYLQAPQAGESVATALQALLADASRGPVLVLGSMWPDHWRRLTQAPADPADPDPHPAVRALLGRAEEITSPPRFTDRQLADLAQTIEADPRLRIAVQRAPGGQVTQELAGARELLRRYRHADAAEQALLWAAMDARRLGHGRYLTEPFLRHAAPGYLDEHTWDQVGGQEDWFTAAVDRLTAEHRRLPGPLIEHQPRPGEPSSAQPLYRLADYLDQHGRRERALLCPPTAFWEAATRHACTPADLAALAAGAIVRGRYRHAARLAQQGTDAGDLDALQILAQVWERVRSQEEAERLYRRAADAGDFRALRWLAQRREKAGDQQEARRLYQQAADAGDSSALFQLTVLWRGTGDQKEGERLYRQAVDAGNSTVVEWLFRMREAVEGRQEAERFVRQAIDDGTHGALRWLAELRERAKDQQEAERLYREAADAGDFRALGKLALMRKRAGDWQEAERLARQAVEAGDRGALRWLADLHEKAGDQQEAERLYRQAADAGDFRALMKLAQMREKAGDQQEAERLVCQAVDAGARSALGWLAELREEAGDQQEAERLYRQAADAGDSYALSRLAQMRKKAGKQEETESLYRQAADAGDFDALNRLARMRAEAGNQQEAERLVRFGLTAEGEIEAPWSP